VGFCSDIFKRLCVLIQRYFREEPAEILLRFDSSEEEGLPDYMVRAFEDDSTSHPTPYQVALYHPLADERPRKAMKEAMAEVERLITVGWLKVSEGTWPLRKVTIPGQVYESLFKEFNLSEGERKERFGLLHGRIQGEMAHVEDLTENSFLEEKGFFKIRAFKGMSFAVKAYQMIGTNLKKWLGLDKPEIIGTYHTHLLPYRYTPSLRDMALLMANPGKPHLIICGLGLFVYTFKSFKRILWITFPAKTSLEIILT